MAQTAPPATAEAANPDGAAVREALASVAKAFGSKDAKALAALWTAEGEFRNATGVVVSGQQALEAGFRKLFAGVPEIQAEIRPESLRFLGHDLALATGDVTVRKGPAAPPTLASFEALVVRENGRWLLARLTESAARGPSVADLDWLIGEWHSDAGQAAQIRTVYTWSASKKFIRAEFLVQEKEIVLRGSQVIGVDPATGDLHSWTFEADGGVGEADWRRDGDHWVLDASGTLVDGRALIETNLLQRIDPNTMTWQSVRRTLDDKPLADLPPVKMTRVAPAK